MKINSKNIKKHSRKIKDASEEELSKVQGEYKKLMGNIKLYLYMDRDFGVMVFDRK